MSDWKSLPVKLHKWSDDEACVLFGVTDMHADIYDHGAWSQGMWMPFPSREHAEEFAARWNAHLALIADLARVTAERDRLRAACVNVLSRIEQLQEQWGKEGFTDGTARMLREAINPTTT